MRRSIPLTALLATVLCATVSPAAARADRETPQPQQPSAPGEAPTAPRAAWSTVNICNPPEHPNAMGVRLSMPARGHLRQWVRVRVQYFDAADGLWHLVPTGGDAGWYLIGRGARTVQTGWTFTFQPPSPGHRLLMRGLVNLQWRRRSHPVRRKQLVTEAGHADPTDAQLASSQAACEIDG